MSAQAARRLTGARARLAATRRSIRGLAQTGDAACSEIEQILEKALALFLSVIRLLGRLTGGWLGRRRVSLRGLFQPRGALDELVQLAAIKPHATTLGTIVNLDALSFRHHEIDRLAEGTLHGYPFLRMNSLHEWPTGRGRASLTRTEPSRQGSRLSDSSPRAGTYFRLLQQWRGIATRVVTLALTSFIGFL